MKMREIKDTLTKHFADGSSAAIEITSRIICHDDDLINGKLCSASTFAQNFSFSTTGSVWIIDTESDHE